MPPTKRSASSRVTSQSPLSYTGCLTTCRLSSRRHTKWMLAMNAVYSLASPDPRRGRHTLSVQIPVVLPVAVEKPDEVLVHAATARQDVVSAEQHSPNRRGAFHPRYPGPVRAPSDAS